MSDSTRGSGKGLRIVVIGTSLGGLEAIRTVLSHLSDAFPLPIVACQHRGSGWDQRVENLYRLPGGPRVFTAEDKIALRPGCFYVAPSDYHTLVDEGSLCLSTEEPVSYARPSIDVLFESAADAYGSAVAGVLMTGASSDGANGLAEIKRRGGVAVVQDPETAVAPVMPRSALRITEVDAVLRLEEIGPYLVRLVGDGE